ncbi:MAG: DoxX family protein, partial [Oligoflexus sp.]
LLTPRGQEFIKDLIATGYMLPLWKGSEVVTGVLLLLNRYVALATVLIAPVIVNIVAFHVFLDPGNTPISLILTSFWMIIAFSKSKSFRPLFKA